MKNHPNHSMLDQFAIGDLDEQLSLVIAAHVGDCRKCLNHVQEKESKAAASLFKEETESPEFFEQPPDLTFIQNTILKKSSQPIRTSDSRDIASGQLVVDNKEVSLPTSLSKLKKYMKPWKVVSSSIRYSKIDVGGTGNLYFVYFAPGAKIPEHGHNGNEFAYVVAGSFSDQSGEYISGDFAYYDHSDSHHPCTNDPDGCLLLVKLDGPFVFKEGLARLLNPIRNILFRYS